MRANIVLEVGMRENSSLGRGISARCVSLQTSMLEERRLRGDLGDILTSQSVLLLRHLEGERSYS
jgi:hypothetical protein